MTNRTMFELLGWSEKREVAGGAGQGDRTERGAGAAKGARHVGLPQNVNLRLTR